MEIIDSNNYIDDAKELLKTASNYLAELKKADIELRDSFMYSNDEINNLNKVMISNTLIFNKIKKFKEEHKEGECLNGIKYRISRTRNTTKYWKYSKNLCSYWSHTTFSASTRI